MQRFTSQLVEHCPTGQGYMVTVKPKLPIGAGSHNLIITIKLRNGDSHLGCKSFRLETKGGKPML